MVYYVYLIKTLKGYLNKSYVGYTNDLQKRLNKHNTNLGARSTKGYKWQIIFKRRFTSKSKAMSYEYLLKNNRKKRLSILKES